MALISPPNADVELIPRALTEFALDPGAVYTSAIRLTKGYSHIVGTVLSSAVSAANGFVVRQGALTINGTGLFAIRWLFERTWGLGAGLAQAFSIEVLNELVQIQLTNGVAGAAVQLYAALRIV